jgi:hypothetical protein
MKATIAAIGLVILSGLSLLAASQNPVVGKWNCESVNNETGMKVSFTLNVKEEAHQVSASITLTETGDEIVALEPTLEGNTFRFKIKVNPEETIEMTATVEGKQITGTFKGKDSGTGSFKGVRQ